MHSPLLLLLLSLVFLVTLSSPSSSSSSSSPHVTAPSDVAALAALKAAVVPSSIPPSSCLASWDFSHDPCRHFVCGLTCTAQASPAPSLRVASLALDPAGYAGSLAAVDFSVLAFLSHLDFADNAFHGSLPSSLSSLQNLRTLVLASNAFSGAIPPAFSRLTALRTLDLSGNALVGAVPESLAWLANLTTLDLSSNQLSGDLPRRLPRSLVSLALRGNSLSGELKRPAFAPLRALEVAELSANQIQGNVEAWFLLLPSLQQVNLANNSLEGIEVATPPANGDGGRLVSLDLGFNRIEGKLPAELVRFPSLAALSLRHNRLKGPIPLEYSAAPFRRLFLDGNFLNGRVPEGLVTRRRDEISGSLGDNCLEGCLPEAAICSPVQKPEKVCKQIYGVGGGRRSHLLLD